MERKVLELSQACFRRESKRVHSQKRFNKIPITRIHIHHGGQTQKWDAGAYEIQRSLKL